MEKSTCGIKNFSDLPQKLKNILTLLKTFVEAKVSSISTSPERKDTILIEDPFKINLLVINFLILLNLACAFAVFQKLYFQFV